MFVMTLGRIAILAIAGNFLLISPSLGAGDVERGARSARSCMACHSFSPGNHLTGPSLAGLWGRRSGSAAGFGRYSDALKRSEFVWDEKTLDAWLRNPAELIPGNTMLFNGIHDPGTREDLLAYLRSVSEGRVSTPERGIPNLKRVESTSQVAAIHYCGDAYRVVTGDGKSRIWWEFNLRFKTDGSADGPSAGKPVIIGSGMQGDRASVVFSRPEEISAFIRRECP